MRRIFALLVALAWFALPALAGVDVNNASQSELESLPGIGPSKALAIIEYRTQHGPFTSVEQLDLVPGIGPATLANIAPLVEIGEGVTAGSEEDRGAPAATESSAGAGRRVNINTATIGELDELPGIGPSKAAAIAADRDANGPFRTCDDLGRVRGIGEATLAGLLDSCTVE